jgi:two-component system response regulator AtoC
MKIQERVGTILVGEDELEVREYLKMALRCLGYSVELAQDGDEVLEYLTASDTLVSAVLLDIMMPQRDGMDVLKEIRRIDPHLPVIIVSGAHSTMNIVTAMKCGATDFLCKPVEHDELQKALARALESRTAPDYSRPVRVAVPKNRAFLGMSRRMVELQSMVAGIGSSEAPVLIQGETGCGKEVFARELHAHSLRAGKIFLKLNCAALPSELVESELFGYERGAFTGAFQKKLGMFELASGGTLMLDEIGDMDFRLQAKLLQVLQDHEFQRIGGKEVIKVDVRIIAATHCDLERAIVDRTFREDLFYRLNVINIQLPPLRERSEDIVPLAEYLIERHSIPGRLVPTITPELKHALMTYHWPGNVRELENVVRRLIVLCDAGLIARELLAKSAHRPLLPARDKAAAIHEVPKPPTRQTDAAPILEQVLQAKHQAEATAILAALNATRWNRKQAAARLQIDYKALLYKMKKLGLEETTADVNAAPLGQPPDLAAAGGGF